MANGFLMALSGGMQGLGAGMVENARVKREAALEALRQQRLDARAKEERDFTADQNAKSLAARSEESRLDREARANESKADREHAERLSTLKTTEETTFRPMTVEEKVAAGIDPKTPAQVDSRGKIDQIGGGGTTINMGGGSDKQVFDAMAESATSARAAVTGLNAISEARKAVEGGAILGAGADYRLGLQKVGSLMGVSNPEAIVNTETFRAAIAPQIAAMMKATVGSTQISNADRDFAEKAAGGSINLDEGSIKRLLGIMEKASRASVDMHQKRLDKVYPDGAGFERERAIFAVDAPAPPASDGPSATSGQTKNKIKWSFEP